MAIDWVNVGHNTVKPSADIRIPLDTKGATLRVHFRIGIWRSKFASTNKIAIGFKATNGVPFAMYIMPSSSGYAMNNTTGNSTPYARISVAKLNQIYPRLKISEMQGDYLLRHDDEEKAYYISLGAKSY